ncbi:MAG: galactokinase, partial [Clostridia bacterium]|nr:galactokinase [Clostridia bacterium]
MSDHKYRISASGRVNLIGEHVDYCGGKVLPAALSLKNVICIRPNKTDKINLKWTTTSEEISLDIYRLNDYRSVKFANYIAGSLLEWKMAGNEVIGADMLYDCRVPFGSGLSSSAAIEVSTIAAMATITGKPFDKTEVAIMAQKAEREYAGVNCGIMDQYASACGKKGHA